MTNTTRFFARNKIPGVHIATYSLIVVDVKPQREDPIIVWLSVGGTIIEYPGIVTSNRVDLATFNIHINSVISRRGARYAGWDIGNYYLETPMGWL